jgi:hypothetical protein
LRALETDLSQANSAAFTLVLASSIMLFAGPLQFSASLKPISKPEPDALTILKPFF